MGDRERLVLLWTFPLFKRDWHYNFTNQSISNLYPFATFAHFPLPSVHLLQRKCSWFLLPSGLRGYCKINLLDKTLEALTQVGSSVRSTQPTLEDSVLTANPNTRSSPWLLPLPILCRHCDGLSKHTHAQIHTQSAATQDPDCPDIYSNSGGGKGKRWLKCTGWETAWSWKIRRMIQHSKVSDCWLLPKGALSRE